MENHNNTLKTILVAEDDDANYKFLEITLVLAKFKVIRAENGLMAVEIFQNQTIDFIFMDMKMPEMDGIEATIEIRKINKDVPIIAQTAYSTHKDELMAIQAGCNNFITKPLERKKVLAIIGEYL